LAECKHKIPLYANVKYQRQIRVDGWSGVKMPKIFRWRRAGKSVKLRVSMELVMQLMVPRCTGVELTIESIGNAISNMMKAMHSVAVSRAAAAFEGVLEHTKLFTYALVRAQHQKVKKVPFPRAFATSAQ
jgi:hypothetical protein